MPVPHLQVGMLSVFALSREKENKRILKTWILSKEEVREPKYQSLREFVASNLTTLLNRRETEFLSKGNSREAPYRLPSIDVRREQSSAFLVRFESGTKKEDVLAGLQEIRNINEFQKAAREVAQWYADTQRWPKSYLFVTCFEVIEGAARIALTGILTAEVTSDVFVEDPSKVVDLLKQGIIGANAKKAMILPHITGRREDSIRSDGLVKIYEDTPVPSQYFYSFADLIPPRDPEEIVGQAVYDVSTGPQPRTLSRLSAALRADVTISGAAALVDVKVSIDEIVISIPFKTFERSVRFFRLPDGRKGIVFVGQSVSCLMGGRDLLESKIASYSKGEKLDDLLER
jgi:hypothetical protein